MLLRLIEHPRVIVLLTHVLDCYKKKEVQWLEVRYLGGNTGRTCRWDVRIYTDGTMMCCLQHYLGGNTVAGHAYRWYHDVACNTTCRWCHLHVLLLLQFSNKIYAALLPHVGKLHVVLDKPESILAIYQLLMTMSPESVTFKVCTHCQSLWQKVKCKLVMYTLSQLGG